MQNKYICNGYGFIYYVQGFIAKWKNRLKIFALVRIVGENTRIRMLISLGKSTRTRIVGENTRIRMLISLGKSTRTWIVGENTRIRMLISLGKSTRTRIFYLEHFTYFRELKIFLSHFQSHNTYTIIYPCDIPT